MSVATAYSTKADPAAAVAEIRAGLAAVEPALVLAFGSPALAPEATAAALAAAFPGARIAGCTTAGEIVSGQMLKGSLVAMAFDAAHLSELDVQVVTGLSDGVDVDPAFAGFAEHFGTPVSAMPLSEYVGIVLVDGLSGAEERLMEAIGDRTNVVFVGGSAGDDVAFKQTHVFADGKAVSDAAVLVLMKPGVGFSILKTQSFVTSEATLVATKTDEAAREVLEFDGRPAVEAYAEAVGLPLESASDGFMSHPVGLMVGDEPYVRSPQQALENGGIRFYCNVVQGMELAVLNSTDIIAETRTALSEAEAQAGGLSALVNFNCILRTLELDAKGLSGAYGELFTDIPTVGFSTYGEQYFGHINQTATMLAFAKE
ncbi:MAG: FIST N-terminal domain-containing protein [Coriobacteriia bacterium]|nr:FIST N-terminal domain-containing protein [Coriobacteriia bacterium]